MKETTTKRVSRTKALELMNNSKGRFMTVSFTKKDGTLRTMNCTRVKGTNSGLGYVCVKEVKSKKFRNVNLQTLKSLTLNKVTNKVR